MTLWLTIVSTVFFAIALVVIFVVLPKKETFVKFLEQNGFKLTRKNKKYIETLDDETKGKIMAMVNTGKDVLVTMDGNKFENSIKFLDVKHIEFDKFFACFRMIHVADPSFSLPDMLAIYNAIENPNKLAAAAIKKEEEEEAKKRGEKILKVPESSAAPLVKKNTLESFARSWCDQYNSNLEIDVDTALEFIRRNRDFPNFVNLDIMAKRAEIEVDEKRLINDIQDEEGLKKIIYSLIRAKYEGIYLSEEDSLRINKANVLEYNDTFKITQTLLMDLYNLGRDVNRFTNVMIRAHNSGIRINFSITDLYSLSDSEFDNLVSNIIRASDFGINVDQKDLIRQNIQGNDISNLISALIKSAKANLDFSSDELMNYLVNTRADVVKYVDAFAFAKKNKLDVSKDYLVEVSKPEIDLFDFVQALKIAKDLEKEEDNFGITENSVKAHFKKFGRALDAVSTVIKAQKEMGLKMNFGIAGKILEGKEFEGGEKFTLKSAISWAQNPQVLPVEPCVTCVCKNGVQITPKINITVRGKMEQIFWGYKLDVLNKRINEAVISEFESAADHESILKTLPQISLNVLRRINEEDHKEIKTNQLDEEELNQHCSYNLLDVNIYDVEIGSNVKAELELRQAQIESEMRRLKAEADKAKAEADIRIAMVEQYHKGIKPNFNELHKANLLAEISEDINSGYEQPEKND